MARMLMGHAVPLRVTALASSPPTRARLPAPHIPAKAFWALLGDCLHLPFPKLFLSSQQQEMDSYWVLFKRGSVLCKPQFPNKIPASYIFILLPLKAP